MSTGSETRVPILLIHGFPLDRAMWRGQIESLRDIARPIAPDLRGFGDAGDAPEILNMGDHAADLKALLTTMGIQKAVICGLSMGGYIALAFLHRYPTMVQGLVLCHTKAGEDSEESRKNRQITAKKAIEEGSSVIADGLIERMLSDQTKRTRVDIVEEVRTMMERQKPQAIAAASRGMAVRPDRSTFLTTITVPTLIITSEKDALIPKSESVAMHKAIPGSEIVSIPNSSHLSNMENSEDFDHHLRLFLMSVGRKQSVPNE